MAGLLTGLLEQRQRREPVFLSFCYEDDAFRVQQIKNMGAIEGQPILSSNEWESVRRRGPKAIEDWIGDQLKYKRCVIVLVGSRTAERPWVQYEIEQAWRLRKGLFGIYINDLKCLRTRSTCRRGKNPFARLLVNGRPLSDIVPVYTPDSLSPLRDVRENISQWIDDAIDQARNR